MAARSNPRKCAHRASLDVQRVLAFFPVTMALASAEGSQRTVTAGVTADARQIIALVVGNDHYTQFSGPTVWSGHSRPNRPNTAKHSAGAERPLRRFVRALYQFRQVAGEPAVPTIGDVSLALGYSYAGGF